MTGNLKNRNTVGQRLRLFRLLIDVDHAELSVNLNINRSYLKKVEEGKASPTDVLFMALTHKYGVAYPWISVGKGNMFAFQGPLTPLSVYITSQFYGLLCLESDVRAVAEMNHKMQTDRGFRDHMLREAARYSEMKKEMLIFSYDIGSIPTKESIYQYNNKYLAKNNKKEGRPGLRVRTLANPYIFGVGAAFIIEELTDPIFYHLAVYNLSLDTIVCYRTSPSIKELNSHFREKFGGECSVYEFPMWTKGKRPGKNRIAQVFTDASRALTISIDSFDRKRKETTR